MLQEKSVWSSLGLQAVVYMLALHLREVCAEILVCGTFLLRLITDVHWTHVLLLCDVLPVTKSSTKDRRCTTVRAV